MVLGGGRRDDIPLSAVYTALDVTAEARVGGREGMEGRATPGSDGVSLDLRGDASYLERLRSRIEAEAEAARRERERRRPGEPPAARRARPGRRRARRGARRRAVARDRRHPPYLEPLAESPLMLTMMTDLHASAGGRLRGGRAGIYEGSVVLLLDRWNEVRDVPEGGTVAEQLGMSVDEIRRALERLAFDVHRERGAAGDRPAEITDAELWRALDRERSRERVVDERRVMDYLHQRSGILMGECPSLYRFPHRSYQEYLAAGHLIRVDFPELLRTVLTEDAALWREVVQLAAGQVASATPFMLWLVLEVLVPEAPPETTGMSDPGFERALYAALAIRETGIWRRAGAGERKKLEPIRRWLERSLEIGALPPVDRAEAGRVLALLGDRRPGVGVSGDGVPDVAWVDVPAGAFRMGSSDEDEPSYRDEKPQHAVDLEGFAIGRYPVTNAQYAAFVEDGGYTEARRDCWTRAGWEWKGERQGPDDELPPDVLPPNHPRVNIPWYEAHAFCRWLSSKLGTEVRLPNEAEWEKVARGPDGAIYPWGDPSTPRSATPLRPESDRPARSGCSPPVRVRTAPWT